MNTRTTHHDSPAVALADAARLTLRLAAFAAVVVHGMATLAARPRHRASLLGRARWLQGVCRRALRAIGVQASWTGVPLHGGLVVANHLGYLDILVLAAQHPCVFVAKREIAGWPVFGWFARQAGTRFIDRERRTDVARVGGALLPAIASGACVVLFLEGTSSDGRAVLPFRSSLLAPAAAAGMRITPAAIQYRAPGRVSVEQEVCWWGDMTFAAHFLRLLSRPGIRARVAVGAAVRAADDRKALARELHAQVGRLHAAARADRPASPIRADFPPTVVADPVRS